MDRSWKYGQSTTIVFLRAEVIADTRKGMCKNLVEKGNLEKPLIIFNRTTKRAEDLSKQLPAGKTQVVSSIDAAVTSADIVFTCLGDDKAITDAIETSLKGDVNGKLFVDCSTIHPDTTNALAKAIVAQGAEFVASPGNPLNPQNSSSTQDLTVSTGSVWRACHG